MTDWRRLLTGARIEIQNIRPRQPKRKDASSRGRELKQFGLHGNQSYALGRLLTGARIETILR